MFLSGVDKKNLGSAQAQDNAVDHQMLYAIKQEIETLLSQMQCYQSSCYKMANDNLGITAFVTNLDAQNSASEQKAVYHKNMADRLGNEQASFAELQSIVAQAQAAQENANAALALAHVAQLQAQAAQNFANAALSIEQKINKELALATSLSPKSALTYMSNTKERTKNILHSIQTTARSAQSSYYSIQNIATQAQEKPDRIYMYVNNLSNTIA